MNIKLVGARPLKEALEPALVLDVSLEYDKNQVAPIGLSGTLAADDGKILGSIREMVAADTKPREVLAVKERHHSFDEYRRNLMAVLSPRAVEYIEHRRAANDKQDVVLLASVEIKLLRTHSVMAPLRAIPSPSPHEINLPGGKSTYDIVGYVHRFYEPLHENLCAVSADRNGVFLKVHEQAVAITVKLPSRDWTHDHAPYLGLGTRLVFELPVSTQTISRAWAEIRKGDKAFLDWSSKGVFSHCRDAGVALDSAVKAAFGEESFTYTERWGRTYRGFEKKSSFNHAASLDLHLQEYKEKVGDDAVVLRHDCQHLLTWTKSLAKFAEDLLHEKAQ